MVRLLREASAIEIVRVKDRFSTPSAGGWRDLMINYKLAGSDHVCELRGWEILPGVLVNLCQ